MKVFKNSINSNTNILLKKRLNNSLINKNSFNQSYFNKIQSFQYNTNFTNKVLKRNIHNTNSNLKLFNFGSKVQPTEINGVKLYPPRTKAYRAYRAARIIFKAIIISFGLTVAYVMISEYFEDQVYRKANEDDDGTNVFKLTNQNDEFPEVIWPLNNSINSKGIVKPKLVILGSGWGSIGLLKNLNKDEYDILVISPMNYFLFTPLLPSATVGTLEPRSLLEPIRKILRRFGPNKAHYFNAKAIDVDIENRRVLVQGDEDKPFYVPYDHLVVAVGSQSITFGIKGLEYAHFLHQITDARNIRKRLFDLLDKASLPSTTKEERKKLLSFVICGGGPTGVEFAAELEDFLVTDLKSYFPDVADDISITIIQSREHILNTYDEQISKYTEERFKHHNINVITNARVKELQKDKVIFTLKNSKGEIEEHEIPHGLVLWSTGIAMRPLINKIKSKLEAQVRSRALTVDGTLRIKGADDGSIFALGDCASIEIPKIIDRMVKYFENADVNKDGYLDFEEFKVLTKEMIKEVPRASAYIPHLLSAFKKYDIDESDSLDISEVETMIKEIDSKMTSLPATAQVANQEGKYLAKLLNNLFKEIYQHNNRNLNEKNITNNTLNHLLRTKIQEFIDNYPKFTYKHLGSLAYIGSSAVAELENPASSQWFNKSKFILAGFSAMYLWRSVYWSEQVSARNRVLLSLDWMKRILFGRDLSRL